MATKTFNPAVDAPPTGSNGRAPARGATSLTPPRSRIRIPELGVGLGMVLVFALGAVIVHLNATEQTPALAAAQDVARGDVLEATDVRVVYLSSDDAIAHLDDTQLSSVLGQVALVDLPAGTLIPPTAIADSVSIESGEAVAGVALEPGQYPARGLAVGDRVNVVRSTDVNAGDVVETVIARDAVVFEVEELATDRRLVSLVASESDAESIAAAAGSGTLRLVMVGR